MKIPTQTGLEIRQREEASGMGAGKLGAQALVGNPSTMYLYVTSKSNHLCKQAIPLLLP